jgi:integrase|nr:MAG TPA: Integrase [Caudoviricetes sp.]
MATKKTNGEGSIYYSESKKLYEGKITIGFDSNGKQIRKSVYAKKKTDVVQKLNKLKSDLLNNDFTQNNDATIYEIAKQYINNQYEANQVSASTLLRNKNTLAIIDKLDIAHIPIQKVTNNQISNELLKIKDYSNSIISKIYGMLSTAYNQAVINNVVKTNPFLIKGAILRVKSNKDDKKVDALTIDEQKAFISELEKSNDEYKDIFYIAMYTGARIGEILGLFGSNINLKTNYIIIDKTLTKNENDEPIVGKTTKTYAGTREIPITKHLIPVISKYASDKNELIFTKNNEIIAPATINSHFKKICKNANIRVLINSNKKVYREAGISNVNLKTSSVNTHMLRHTFATRCIEAGVSAVALSRILGHKDIQTTLNTYTSVFNKFKEDELAKINKYFDTI